MLWAIIGIVVLGAVFVTGALLGSSVTRSVAGGRRRVADRDAFARDLRDPALRPRSRRAASLYEDRA